MNSALTSLSTLGWSHFYQQQLSLDEWQSTQPARVFALNRHLLEVAGSFGTRRIELPAVWLKLAVESLPTVGDWLLLDDQGQPLRLLERKSLFKRMASGLETRVQLMAANVDTLFVVTSCNQDFNLSRLERYLALALDGGVDPVLVLTKVDLAEGTEEFLTQAAKLRPGLTVVAVNAKDSDSCGQLRDWMGCGQTVALVGSSGVGKSTLVNTLCRAELQLTGDIRSTDAKGRHTTTARSLHLLPDGGILIDSPGLRELQLSDCDNGLATLFEEIEELARQCRFNDCRHQGEVGCAVSAAAERGDLDDRRLTNYLKLRAEQERTAETLLEKRRRDRSFGKMCKSVKKSKNRNEP
ncbi:MAG: ribosome small subunit-dependent GTPase A [Desulfuromonas sp.]|nr:MAG: ribosome small subunit-dependent GTPase A [Desulfuromonas sp.]